MIDLGKRMQDIKETLDSTAAADTPDVANDLQQKEQLLDELMDLVESIDQARDLSSIGGLQTLLSLLHSPHPSLQWRAAEVMGTCVQNNPPVQESFFQGGAMPAVWPLLDHADAICQVKALLAVSCMVRGYPPALLWLRQQQGLTKFVGMLSNSDARVQRKCLQILEYVLRVVPADRSAACLSGATPLVPALTAIVTGSEDSDVRSAALAVGRQLAQDPACQAAMKGDEAFVQAIQAVQCRLDTLPREEWGTAEDEARLATALAADLEKPLESVQGAAASGQGQQAQGSGEAPAALQLMALPSE